MAKKASKSAPPIPNFQEEDRFWFLQQHYLWGVQDMDTRRTRRNGWNETINAYMGVLPVNWPYNAVVTEPLVRTSILEKTSRLLNAKLQGRVLPRHGGDNTKSLINNAILDFQWDYANEGGSMIEKVALADQYARIFGAAFCIVYWDVKKNSNEIKVIDPRDMFFDGAANHIRNARWVQVREFTTFDKLEQRGFDVSKARAMAEKGEIVAELKSSRYESMVKANRGLVDRTGMIDDLKNPVVEVVTEWGIDKDQKPYMSLFLPKYADILVEYRGDDYPYKHGKIPVSMLRYYPLLDDIYGDSEVESVMPLQRAVWAILDGFIDECNIKIRPPLKISATGVRIETIEYGPGAKWIMNSPSAVEELEPNGGFISAFQSVYPALKAAYNTAMGDQSLGVSSSDQPAFATKTATEVVSMEKQQTSRDQYNQLYLSEFLKDIMMMWLENNKQFLLDDPDKQFYVLKILGKDMIQNLQRAGLADSEIPTNALHQIGQTVLSSPNVVSGSMLQSVMSNVTVPKHPVITKRGKKIGDLEMTPKLKVGDSGHEADLYITPEDFEGEYDYVPDVKSMSIGAGLMQQQARQQALQYALNPELLQMLQSQGDQLKIKELLTSILEDAGDKDAEGLFEPAPKPQNEQPQDKPSVSINYRDLPPDGQVQAAAEAGIRIQQPVAPIGPAVTGASPVANGPTSSPGLGQLPPTVFNRVVGPGLPQAPRIGFGRPSQV